jgi:outer membrane protein OmpU
MKIKTLSLAVAAGLFSVGSQAATLFEDDTSTVNLNGRVEARAHISDANGDEEFKDASRARIEIKGQKALSEDLLMVARYENEIKENTSAPSNVTARHLYVGFEGDFGKIYYGQQDNATTYLTNFSDMTEYFSGYINELNVASADRAKNTLRYAYSNDAFTFQVSANQNSGTRQAEGFGLVGAYKLTDNFEFGLGYASADEKSFAAATSDKNTDTVSIVAAKYTTGSNWIGSTFQTGEISRGTVKDDDFTAYDLYVGFYFDNGSVFDMSYTNFEADSIKTYDMSFIAAEYAYYYQNIAGYVSYKHSLLDEDDYAGSPKWLDYDSTQDELVVGLRFKF